MRGVERGFFRGAPAATVMGVDEGLPPCGGDRTAHRPFTVIWPSEAGQDTFASVRVRNRHLRLATFGKVCGSCGISGRDSRPASIAW